MRWWGSSVLLLASAASAEAGPRLVPSSCRRRHRSSKFQMLIGALGSRTSLAFSLSLSLTLSLSLSHTREKRLKDYECVFIFSHVQPAAIYCPLSTTRHLGIGQILKFKLSEDFWLGLDLMAQL